VIKAPLGGGAPSTLFSGYVAGPMAIDSTYVYWGTGGVASDPTASTTVLEMPLTGGAPTTVVSGQDRIGSLVVDETSLYWIDQGTGTSPTADGKLAKVPLGGGAPITLATGLRFPGTVPGVELPYDWGGTAFAVDATSVYFGTVGTPGNDFSSSTGRFLRLRRPVDLPFGSSEEPGGASVVSSASAKRAAARDASSSIARAHREGMHRGRSSVACHVTARDLPVDSALS
jgi:hypothetical protein